MSQRETLGHLTRYNQELEFFNRSRSTPLERVTNIVKCHSKSVTLTKQWYNPEHGLSHRHLLWCVVTSDALLPGLGFGNAAGAKNCANGMRENSVHWHTRLTVGVAVIQRATNRQPQNVRHDAMLTSGVARLSRAPENWKGFCCQGSLLPNPFNPNFPSIRNRRCIYK